MAEHSTLSPSKWKLYRNCRGCLRQIEKAPKEVPSIHAQRGTDITKLAEELQLDWIKENRNGKVFGRTTIPELLHYLNFVAALANDPAEAPTAVLVEHRLEGLTRYDPDIWGRSDTLVRGRTTTHVVDLKSGSGIMVEVEDEEGVLNAQLEIYLLAALVEAPTVYGQCHIVQPWGSEDRGLKIVRSSKLWKTEDLFHDRLPLVLAEAKAVKECPDGEGLTPGDWCENSFCPARMICPALKSAVIRAQQDFTPMPVSVGNYSLEELGNLMELANRADIWTKEVRRFLLAEAEAGRVCPGYTVEQGMGHAKYKPDSQEASILRSCKLPKKDATVTELKSPTQLQKAVMACEDIGTPEERENVWANVASKHVIREPTSKRLKKIEGALPPASAEPVFAPVEIVPCITEALPDVPTTAIPVFSIEDMLGGSTK